MVNKNQRWKLVYLLMVAGQLLRTSYGQETLQVQVVEEDEQELLKLLQETNFGFVVESNIQKQEEGNSPQLLGPDIVPLEINLENPNEEKIISKTVVPESILQFADFVEQYEPSEQQTENIVAFEVNLQQMLTQKVCLKDFQNFGRTSFNAVGIIRISLLDGTEQYCTGTLVGNDTVITSAECYPFEKNAIRFQYQPAWMVDTAWLTFTSIYIPDKWVENRTNNIAIFFLENPLYDAPTIGFDLGVIQTQQCYITLLGWIFSAFGKEYKMVPCPNLPDVEEQLGIESKNCGEILCNLADMDFQTGSPIILTCPNPIRHAVIGLLREDDESKSSLPFARKTYGFPYMFNLEDYLDIEDKVKTMTP